MNNTVPNKALMNTTIQNGIIAAILNLGGLALLYLLGPAYNVMLIMPNIALMVGISFIATPVAFYSAFQLRKQNGGFIKTKALFKYMFITYVIIETVYTICYVVLYKFIDPEFIRQVVKLSLEQLVKMLHDRGVDPEEISNMVKKQSGAFKDNFTISKLLLGWAIAILRGSIIAIIIAAIAKKNQPDLPPVNPQS